MRIGVLSDTHSKKLPTQLVEDFFGVDLIIHAGDFCSPEDLGHLKKIAKVEAVHGNMDNPDLCRHLPRRKIVTCGKYAIGLFHGEGAPATLLPRVKAEFAKDKVAAVIFGHSHHPMNERIGDVLFFNPGSATDTVFAPYRSYGILEIDDKGIKAEIVKVKD